MRSGSREAARSGTLRDLGSIGAEDGPEDGPKEPIRGEAVTLDVRRETRHKKAPEQGLYIRWCGRKDLNLHEPELIWT